MSELQELFMFAVKMFIVFCAFWVLLITYLSHKD